MPKRAGKHKPTPEEIQEAVNREASYEFGLGGAAYRMGKDEGDCPYVIGDARRTSWYCGYYTDRTGFRLEKQFARLGILWP